MKSHAPRSQPKPAASAPRRPPINASAISAQQRPLEESARGDVYERGLSADVDDLGARFLIEATEQQNLESEQAAANDGLVITEGPPSDEPLADATFDATRDIWEQTVALAPGEPPPSMPGAVDDGELDDEATDDARSSEPPAVVLTSHVVREASLFDEPDGRDDETRVPRLDTDDVGHHARLRRKL